MITHREHAEREGGQPGEQKGAASQLDHHDERDHAHTVRPPRRGVDAILPVPCEVGAGPAGVTIAGMTDEVSYPPEPWVLCGQLHVSVWLVPRGSRPSQPLPSGVRRLLVAGRAVVGTAWVDYQPGGVLSYRELLAATLVRDGVRPRATITGIWVDSVPSRDGGRALWAIPKELARFAFDAATGDLAAEAHINGRPIASALVRRGVRLPGRWPVRFRIVQDRDGQPRTNRVRATARIELGRSDWRIAPDGPLAYLRGLRPRVTVTLADFRMTFGSAPVAAAADSPVSGSSAVAGSR